METPTKLDKAQIRSIIGQKAWYGFEQDTGAFSWDLSVKKLGESFGIKPETLSDLITTQFSPACLVPAEIEEDSQKGKKPMINAVIDLGLTTHIWTVGDPQWQRTKLERVGLAKIISKENYHCANQKKEEHLKQLIEDLAQKGKYYFLVVDDKEQNINQVRDIARELKEKGIVILDYHFKKDDPQANGTAFIKWLKEQLKEYPDLEVFLDFDGVVADTDSVLFGPVVEAIFQHLNNHSN